MNTPTGKFWRPPAIWKGETVFIIGGGPSLEKTEGYPDFAPLHSRRVIGVNDAYTLGKWVDVCFFGDMEWYERHKVALKDFGGLVVTCADARNEPDVLTTMRRKKGFHVEQGYLGWNLNSGAAAINLAAYFGAKRIVLIGFDLKLSDDGKGNWHENPLTPAEGMKFERMQKGFKRLKDGMDNLRPDIEVVNATPGSSLNLWPEVDLKKLLKTDVRIERAEEENEEEEEEFVETYLEETITKPTKIPKNLHFIWIGSPLPDFAKFIMEMWHELNPEYLIHQHAEEVLLSEHATMYENIKRLDHKADILKWSALRRYGGYTIDTDTVPLRPMSSFANDLGEGLMAVAVPPQDEKPGKTRNDMGFLGATTDARVWAAINWYLAGNVKEELPKGRSWGGMGCMDWLIKTVPHLIVRQPSTTYCPYSKRDSEWIPIGKAFLEDLMAGKDVSQYIARYNRTFENPVAWHVWRKAVKKK